MIIEYHKLYMERLARVYLDTYEMYGYSEAKKWYGRTLNAQLKARVKPYIKEEATRRGMVSS